MVITAAPEPVTVRVHWPNWGEFFNAVLGGIGTDYMRQDGLTTIDWAFNAGRFTLSLIERMESRLDRLEGYLQRDEQRELVQRRKHQEQSGLLPEWPLRPAPPPARTVSPPPSSRAPEGQSPSMPRSE